MKFLLVLLPILLMGAGCKNDGTADCQDYSTDPLYQLPLRCYDFYKINKNCFDVEEHFVGIPGKGGHTEYKVTPLCNK